MTARSDLLERGRTALRNAGVPSPEHDAEVLLSEALAVPRPAIRTEPQSAVADEAAARFVRLLTARAARVPLQHLLGEAAFHDVVLSVERGVFIPRPETESLVELVLTELSASRPDRPSYPASGTIADLGTGSGAIAIALLCALPLGWRALGLDRSDRACVLAFRNAHRNGVQDRMVVERGDFANPPTSLPGVPADVLAANLPYIERGAIAGLMPEVRDHDPREALDGGPDGLDSFRAVARHLDRWLKPGGLLALEIAEDQADRLAELFGPHLAGVRVARDLAGLPRILTGRMRGGRA